MAGKFVISVFVLLGFVYLTAATTDKIFCYYGSWSTYRSGAGQVQIENIDPTKCTHIIYAFIGLDTRGTILVMDRWNDITNGGIYRFINLKQRNPNVKLLISLGGWNEGSKKYSDVVNSASLRSTLVNSIVSFTTQYGFDGFNIDWQYPTERGGVSTDRAAFVQLINELRSQFNARNLLLTASVGVGSHLPSTAYNVPSLSSALDYILLMSYDFYGSYDGITGHNSPLYPKTSSDQLSVYNSIQLWINSGANPQKLVLGMAAYGRTFTLSNPNVYHVGASTSGPGNSGSYTAQLGLLSYLEICEQQSYGGWNHLWDDVQKTPYMVKGSQWVGYDNVQSVKLKVAYAIEKNLAGVSLWSVDLEDTKNTCGTGSYPILSAIYSTLKITLPTTTPPPVTPLDKCVKAYDIFGDDENCSVYYVCSPNAGGTFTLLRYQCTEGFYFDSKRNLCNYSSTIKC